MKKKKAKKIINTSLIKQSQNGRVINANWRENPHLKGFHKDRSVLIPA